MNYNKSLRWLFLAAVLFVYLGVSSQQSNISFSSTFKLPDSAALNTSVADTLVILNTDTGNFSGYIAISQSVNHGAPFVYDSTLKAGISFDQTQTDSGLFDIPAGGSVSAAVHVYFGSSAFIAGPSIVVIWPIILNNNLGSTIISDTLKDSVQILLYPASTSDPLPAGLKVYTDAEQLWIKCDEQNALRHVRIFDVSGSLLLEQNLTADNAISMGRFSDGIYLAEITLTNGQQISYKIFSGR